MELQWLSAIPRAWTTFVAIRVSEIQAKLPRAKWKHVCCHDNPADLASRRIDVDELIKSQLWWHGPAFLQPPEDSWPSQLQLQSFDVEKRKLNVKESTSMVAPTLFDTSRFSSLQRLLRMVAYTQIALEKVMQIPTNGHIIANDSTQAKYLLVQQIQMQHLQEEHQL